MTMTSENRILRLLAEGRLARNTWASTDSQGRQLLCLLTALTGDLGTRPESCPADLAPAWVAHLMPWWDDSGTAERWPDLMRQIGELAPRFGELYGETSRRALAGCQLVSLRVTLQHASETTPDDARIIALWERVLRGDEPTDDEWRVVESATTWAVESAAAWAAAEAAWAAAEAATAAEAAEEDWAAAEAASRTASDEIIQGHIEAIRAALTEQGEHR